MKKLLTFISIIISSCVGTMTQMDSPLVKGNYELKLLSVQDSDGNKVSNYNIEKSENTGSFFIDLDPISKDMHLVFSLTKISSNKLLGNDNNFEINTTKKQGKAFDDSYIDYSDCKDKFFIDGQTCTFKVIAKWRGGEDVVTDKSSSEYKDFLDINLKEQLISTYEEAVNFYISVNTHRKAKSKVLGFPSITSLNFGEPGYFTSLNSKDSLGQEISFSVDGELWYDIEANVINNSDDNAFNLNCNETSDRNHECTITFEEEKAPGVLFDNERATSAFLKIEYENGVIANEEFDIPLLGRRKTAPDIVFTPGNGVIQQNTDFTLENNGENITNIDNIIFVQAAGNDVICATALGFNKNTCTNVTSLANGQSCKVTVTVDQEAIGDEVCGATIKYIGDNGRTTKNKEISSEAQEATLTIFSDATCSTSIENLSFDTPQQIALGMNKVLDIWVKNSGDLIASISQSYPSVSTNNFQISENNCGTEITGGTCCNIKLKFNPQNADPNTDIFNINYRDISMEEVDPDKNVNLALSGHALTAANINITSSTNFGEIVNESTLPECEIGACPYSGYYKSRELELTLTNYGEYIATGIQVIGNTHFLVTENNCSQISAGGNCKVKIKFIYNGYSSSVEGCQINQDLNISYESYDNQDPKLSDDFSLTGTILIKGELKAYIDEEEITSNLDFNSHIYSTDGTPKSSEEKTISLTSIKPLSTTIKSISIVGTPNPADDDFDIIDNDCPEELDSEGTCTFKIKFAPIFENDYTGNLSYYEKLNLTDSSSLSKTKNFETVVSYDDQVNSADQNITINSSGISVKPAELILVSLSYNSALGESTDRTITSYSKVEKFVNYCQSTYRLFDETNISDTCTATQGVPFQTFWDFDKGNSNAASNFNLNIKNIGGVDANITSISISNAYFKTNDFDNIGVLGENSLIIDTQINSYDEKTATFSGFIYKSENFSPESNFSYSNYSQSDLSLYAYMFRGPNIHRSTNPINLFHGFGNQNNIMSVEYITTINDPLYGEYPYTGPYASNMPGYDGTNGYYKFNSFTIRYGNIINNQSLIDKLSLGYTTSLGAWTDGYDPVVNIYDGNPKSITVTVSGLQFDPSMDDSNNLCTQFSTGQVGYSYEAETYNKYASTTISPGNTLTYPLINARPKVSFTERTDNNFCKREVNATNANTDNVILTYGGLDSISNVSFTDSTSSNVLTSIVGTINPGENNLTFIYDIADYDIVTTDINVSIQDSNYLEYIISAGEVCDTVTLNNIEINKNGTVYNSINSTIGRFKWGTSLSTKGAYCFNDINGDQLRIENGEQTFQVTLDLDEDLTYQPNGCTIKNLKVDNSYQVTGVTKNPVYFKVGSNQGSCYIRDSDGVKFCLPSSYSSFNDYSFVDNTIVYNLTIQKGNNNYTMGDDTTSYSKLHFSINLLNELSSLTRGNSEVTNIDFKMSNEPNPAGYEKNELVFGFDSNGGCY